MKYCQSFLKICTIAISVVSITACSVKPGLQGRTTLKDNMEMIINAGVDQMGNETNNELVLELVKEGKVTEERVNQAAGRILQWHFKLGLFENPYVDPEVAVTTVQSEKKQKLGYQAQLESIVLLVNDRVLPVKENSKIYVECIEKETANQYTAGNGCCHESVC